MSKLFATLTYGLMMLAGGTASASDMSKAAIQKHDQMMKECMAGQAGSMSKSAARKSCKTELMKKDAMSKEQMGKDKMEKDHMEKETMAN